MLEWSRDVFWCIFLDGTFCRLMCQGEANDTKERPQKFVSLSVAVQAKEWFPYLETIYVRGFANQPWFVGSGETTGNKPFFQGALCETAFWPMKTAHPSAW